MAKRSPPRIVLPAKRPNPDLDPTTAYAFDVCTGRIVAGRLVRLAAERHLRDLVDGAKRGLVWRPDVALHSIQFVAFLKHSKGEWAGKTVVLQPWQQFIHGSIFGWHRKDGLRRFRFAYLELGRKNGKLLADETPVPTPSGWKRHGDLHPGDLIFNPFGQPVRVLAETEHYIGPCRRVVFSDGTEIVAHDRHEWRTNRKAHTGRQRGSRKPLPEIETQEIAATLRHSSRGDLTHGIPAALPLDTGPDVSLPLPPYSFGIWLGDGHSLSATITSADAEVIGAIEAEGVPIELRQAQQKNNKAGLYTLADTVSLGLFATTGKPALQVGFHGRLRSLGVLGDKSVPALYLRSSIRQRRELLAGLVDSDGHVTARGQCEIVLTNRKLFNGVLELARTLGFKPTTVEDRASIYGRDIGPRYRMQFWPSQAELPLRIPRKRDRLRFVLPGRSRTRMIVSCDSVGERTGKCITVEGGMYLAGESMVPTHNSTIAATVALQGLCADKEPGAEVYSAATKKDQARLVFDEARRMVLRSPRLSKQVKVFQRALAVDETMSSFIPLSADERTLDGLNPHFVIIDELHRHKSRAVLDILDTAVGSRRQPLIWIITTAGDENPESVYAAETTYATQVLEGVIRDDAHFGFIATLDPGDRWDDPKVWIKANPNLGISVKMDDLRRQALKASRSPPALVAFKRLRLNLRTSDSERAIDMAVWRKNSDGPFDPAELMQRPFYGAIDLSSRVDLSAWVKIFPPIEGESKWKIVPRFWMPADTVQAKSDRDQVQYRRWIDNGLIEITPGNVIDHSEIQRAVLEDSRVCEPRSIAYDPWNATQLAVALEGEGLPMFEFVQGFRSYTAPTKQLEAWLLSELLDHGGNEVLTWMASNLHVLSDKNENRMPSKKHSTARIDGMVALIMSIGRWMAEDDVAGWEGFLNSPITA